MMTVCLMFDSVMQLAAKYEARVIALTMGVDGIPTTTDGRVGIALESLLPAAEAAPTTATAAELLPAVPAMHTITAVVKALPGRVRAMVDQGVLDPGGPQAAYAADSLEDRQFIDYEFGVITADTSGMASAFCPCPMLLSVGRLASTTLHSALAKRALAMESKDAVSA